MSRTITIKAVDSSTGMTAREIVDALSTGDVDDKTNVIARVTIGGKVKQLSWIEGSPWQQNR